MSTKHFTTFEAFWQAISPSINSKNCPTYHPCCRVWVGRFQKACRESHIQKVSWRAALYPLSSPEASLKESLLAHMVQHQWGTPIFLDSRCSAIATPAALNKALKKSESAPNRDSAANPLHTTKKDLELSSPLSTPWPEPQLPHPLIRPAFSDFPPQQTPAEALSRQATEQYSPIHLSIDHKFATFEAAMSQHHEDYKKHQEKVIRGLEQVPKEYNALAKEVSRVITNQDSSMRKLTTAEEQGKKTQSFLESTNNVLVDLRAKVQAVVMSHEQQTGLTSTLGWLTEQNRLKDKQLAEYQQALEHSQTENQRLLNENEKLRSQLATQIGNRLIEEHSQKARSNPNYQFNDLRALAEGSYHYPPTAGQFPCKPHSRH